MDVQLVDSGDVAHHPYKEQFSDFAACLPYPDVLFEVTTTPNRPDAMSIYGLARDLAARYRVPLRPLSSDVGPTGAPTTGRVVVEDTGRCPRFGGRRSRRPPRRTGVTGGKPLAFPRAAAAPIPQSGIR